MPIAPALLPRCRRDMTLAEGVGCTTIDGLLHLLPFPWAAHVSWAAVSGPLLEERGCWVMECEPRRAHLPSMVR